MFIGTKEYSKLTKQQKKLLLGYHKCKYLKLGRFIILSIPTNDYIYLGIFGSGKLRYNSYVKYKTIFYNFNNKQQHSIVTDFKIIQDDQINNSLFNIKVRQYTLPNDAIDPIVNIDNRDILYNLGIQ